MGDMSSPSPVDEFWQTYVRSLSSEDGARTQQRPAAWRFGGTKAVSDELVELVCRGTKTATCSLLWEHEHDHEPLPTLGALSILLDGQDEPRCIIETTDVEIKPFNAVDAGFAYDEGEGDQSLSYWRKVHWRFFSQTCERLEKTPEETMLVVCERFRVVWAASW